MKDTFLGIEKVPGFHLLMHGSRKIKKLAFMVIVGQKNYSPTP
ncbi:hypothetical protein [Hydrocoleum sp. CS-953]|nr:hypothetical protein [Hydrocoleum sp. CS-953]